MYQILNMALESTIRIRGLLENRLWAVRLARPQPATVRASTPVKTSFIIMVRVREDQGILTLEHLKDTLGVLP